MLYKLLIFTKKAKGLFYCFQDVIPAENDADNQQQSHPDHSLGRGALLLGPRYQLLKHLLLNADTGIHRNDLFGVAQQGVDVHFKNFRSSFAQSGYATDGF